MISRINILRNKLSKETTKKPSITPQSQKCETTENVNTPPSDKVVLEASGLFDSNFYLESYPDVKRAQVDPITHYLAHGAKEGRDPNPIFSSQYYSEHYMPRSSGNNPLLHYIKTEGAEYYQVSDRFDGAHYLKTHPDIAKADIHPLRHYLKYGRLEGRSAYANNGTTEDPASSGRIISDCRDIATTVVIPVFNAIEEVIACIESALANTNLSSKNQLLIVNDGSTDPQVEIKLSAYSKVEHVTIVTNKENLGYTRTINKAVDICRDTDVILLNSDTIVTKFWLRNLKVSAYSNKSIGTVTAVSNNAGAFSVPNPGTNMIPEHLSIESIGKLAAKIGYGNQFETPTGNGFCFYIKRDLINEIGSFDEENFPRGYGEENEFCMRAIDYGWKNIVDPSTYVYHVRSASFKEEKQTLIDEGVRRVKQLYPEYEHSIKGISKSETFSIVRERIAKAIESRQKPKKRILYVISTRTGGTPKTNLDLMNAVSEIYDTFALACDTKKIEILISENGQYKVIRSFLLKDSIKFSQHTNSQYEQIVREILLEYAIDVVHIRHIAWHSTNLIDVCKSLEVPTIKSFHDFYCICPTVNLIDKFGTFHAGGVIEDGLNPLWSDPTAYSADARLLNRWRGRIDRSLKESDYFVTTCESAKDILQKNLPFLKENDKNFRVIHHGRDFEKFTQAGEVFNGNGPLKVLVPGNITQSKGKDLIIEIVKKYGKKKIEFHVLGTCDDELKEFVKYHGKYSREEFTSRVLEIGPHISSVLSIWPETYCHTLTESWACGLPVIGIALGAVERRISKHDGGWLAQPSAKEIYQKLISLRENPSEINQKTKNVAHWQTHVGPQNTTHKMALQYVDLYREAMINKPGAISKYIGFIMKGSYPDVPPTGYVRLVDWKEWFENLEGKLIQFTDWQDVFSCEVIKYEKLVIQRDAIPAKYVSGALETLRKLEISFEYEIDDNLLAVPESADPHGSYRDYQPHFISLLQNASKIWVTNEELKREFHVFNQNIEVRPNRLLKSRWIRTDIKKIGGDELFSQKKFQYSILYFGSKTHSEDFTLLYNAVKALRASGYDAGIYVIGITDVLTDNGICVRRLSPPSSRYDIFVSWLTSISTEFQLGVAPLIENEFTKYKSYLKCLEYTALNLPIICSDVQPYSELKDQEVSKNIEFVPNTVDAWYNELKKRQEHHNCPNSIKAERLLEEHFIA